MTTSPRGLPRESTTSRPASLRLHPEASLVPPMTKAEYAELRSSIGERGILSPLEVTPEGVVLDGRARLRAALDLELEHVPVRIVAPENEVEYMVLAAIQRRHLTASQRAALALELVRYEKLRDAARRRQRQNLRQYTEVATLPPRGKTCERVAAIAGVSPRTALDVIAVYEEDRGLFEQVKANEIAGPTAARRVRRRRRDAALAPAPPLPKGPFDLIYADPPWQMGNPDASSAPENHYATMAHEEIKAFAVPAAQDAVLLLWAVNMLLPEALEVMAAWGFTYKAKLVWVKDSPGPGNWFRNQHETLLLGIKGRFPAPDPEDRVASVAEARRGRHSEKPACVYELIERMYPHASKVELFARGKPRPGWVIWGNEADTAEDTEEES
jgi:N6-adenosine-specific RNA methylase IME4